MAQLRVRRGAGPPPWALPAPALLGSNKLHDLTNPRFLAARYAWLICYTCARVCFGAGARPGAACPPPRTPPPVTPLVFPGPSRLASWPELLHRVQPPPAHLLIRWQGLSASLAPWKLPSKSPSSSPRSYHDNRRDLKRLARTLVAVTVHSPHGLKQWQAADDVA